MCVRVCVVIESAIFQRQPYTTSPARHCFANYFVKCEIANCQKKPDSEFKLPLLSFLVPFKQNLLQPLEEFKSLLSL